MQATLSDGALLDFDQYLKKSFYKTGSLFAHSAKAVAVVGRHSPETAELAYEYGRNLGMAFQIVDDILDFTVRPPTFLCSPPKAGSGSVCCEPREASAARGGAACTVSASVLRSMMRAGVA
jgi:hypothetical protein